MKLVTTLRSCGLALFASAFLFGCLSLLAPDGDRAHAAGGLEERRTPMRFAWNDCGPDCRGWISAAGIVTADTPGNFDEFARGRDLSGAAIVLDSSGGSVNDAIALGRRWRKLGLLTTVGTTIAIRTPDGARAAVVPGAACESMCVFLLLAGKARYVPEGVYVRVHQIWMGDRADNAKASSYSAHDMMIVERDIGRLAKFTFDMGGTGDLLSLALNVPPWEDLHTLTRSELQLTNLSTTEIAPDVLRVVRPAEVAGPGGNVKEVQDRLISEAPLAAPDNPRRLQTKTAEAAATGSVTGLPP